MIYIGPVLYIGHYPPIKCVPVLYIGHYSPIKYVPVLYIGHWLGNHSMNVLYIGQVGFSYVPPPNNDLYIGRVEKCPKYKNFAKKIYAITKLA